MRAWQWLLIPWSIEVLFCSQTNYLLLMTSNWFGTFVTADTQFQDSRPSFVSLLLIKNFFAWRKINCIGCHSNLPSRGSAFFLSQILSLIPAAEGKKLVYFLASWWWGKALCWRTENVMQYSWSENAFYFAIKAALSFSRKKVPFIGINPQQSVECW